MEKKAFQQGMAYLAAAYAAEIGRERAAVYWDQLRAFPDEAFLRAVVAADERFPAAARLREAAIAEARHVREEAARRIAPARPADRAKVLSLVAQLREKMRMPR